MRISPKLKWIRPYAHVALSFIPPEKELERIAVWTLGKSRGTIEHGACIQNVIGAPYRIWLHTHYVDADNKDTPFSKIDILKLLAHEIAHMVEWNHTPRHAILEARITIALMTMLDANGYQSEEWELG